MDNRTIFIMAGEASGDQHGGKLMQSLLGRNPRLEFYGVGGPNMLRAGLKQIVAFEDFQVMGFSDIIWSLPRLIKRYKYLLNWIMEKQPEAVIFIDYPGFNLRLASALRKAGYKGTMVHYIAPTVWAWGKDRIQSMAADFDLLLVIYPFEPSYFKDTPLPVYYVGNPLIETIQQPRDDSQWRKKTGMPDGVDFIALFPGSREGEIKRNFPVILKTAELLLQKDPSLHFALSANTPEFAKMLEKACEGSKLVIGNNCWIIPGEMRYSTMREAKGAIAKSGTITLELALMGCPSVVVYRLSFLNYMLARYLFRINLPNYSLPNILLNEPHFVEWIGLKLDPQQIADSLEELMAPDIRASFQAKAESLKQLLTDSKASQTAANEILKVLK